jgi:hypothetical protein
MFYPGGVAASASPPRNIRHHKTGSIDFSTPTNAGIKNREYTGFRVNPGMTENTES